MKQIFSIWKGIVSKKSLNAVKKYIDETNGWSYSEDDNSLNVFSDVYSSINGSEFPNIFREYNLLSYIIYS